MTFHSPLNLDKTFWTVLCDGEGHTVSTRSEAEHLVSGTFGIPFKVIEWNVAENSIHDVTMDFVADDEPDEFDGDYAHADHFRALCSRTMARGA